MGIKNFINNINKIKKGLFQVKNSKNFYQKTLHSNKLTVSPFRFKNR